ncbi:GNAT family N-acetyltransferase [Acinetobacter piscicola]|uniref:GNAT family N-acetyltransferase n=1 Tax=Acinetobacter piscicola TaxID=2006115 RepID=UPI000B7CAE08|nr:N-acetyltransferase [Acinetobacter piscicola]
MRALVRKATLDDVNSIAMIHQQAFIRQIESHQWIGSTLAAYPRFFCYVIIESEMIVGYIFWAQKSGFRTEVILELDQIAMHKDFQGLGLSKKFIVESLRDVQVHLTNTNQSIKSILVTTGADNFARKLYENVLNAKEVAVISGLYRSPEVYLKSTREDLVFLD